MPRPARSHPGARTIFPVGRGSRRCPCRPPIPGKARGTPVRTSPPGRSRFALAPALPIPRAPLPAPGPEPRCSPPAPPPATRAPQVVVLGLQPLHPQRLLRPTQLGLFREGQEVVHVRAPDLFSLSALFELLPRVLVDGFQHHEPGLLLGAFLLLDKALVQKGGDTLEGIHRQIFLRVADRLYG